MGQQQLFIVILVTIILGIATLVAIDTFTESLEEANKEAVRVELLETVPYARAYYAKSAMFGGGDKSFANIKLYHLALDSTTENADYVLNNESNNSFEVVATPRTGGDDIVLEIQYDQIIWK